MTLGEKRRTPRKKALGEKGHTRGKRDTLGGKRHTPENYNTPENTRER